MSILNPGNPTEFGFGYNGDCGETALACAIAAYQHRRVTVYDVAAIVRSMAAQGLLAAANGASTLAALAQYVKDAGLPVAHEIDYAGDDAIPPQQWADLLYTYAGKAPVVLQVANGQALRDKWSGRQDERGLQYHFVCIVGHGMDGFYATDGDYVPGGPPQSAYQCYDDQTLLAAKVCGVLIVGQ